MSWGIRVTAPSGVVVANQEMPGGRIYLGEVFQFGQVSGTQSTFIFPLVPGGQHLRVLQIGRAGHSFVTGTNGNGEATVTLTAQAREAGGTATRLQVFTVQTVEPNFGVNIVNAAGERTISSVRPVPEFLGRAVLSGTGSMNTGEAPYWRYSYTANVGNLGGGRRRIILWELPITSADIWFQGDSFVLNTLNSAYSVNGYFYAPAGTTIPAAPIARVFALDGMVNSAAPFGFRVFDSAGALIFDAGYSLMVNAGIETLTYPTGTGSVITHTHSSSSGITPAIFVPEFGVNRWTFPGGTSSILRTQVGTVRRTSATQLDTRLVTELYEIVDIVRTGTFLFGNAANLPVPVVNASNYP